MGPLYEWPTTGAAVPAAAGDYRRYHIQGLQVPEWAPWEGCGFLLKYFYSTLFSTWKLIKYFLCAWCNNRSLFLSSSLKGSTKESWEWCEFSYQVSAGKVMRSCSKEDRLRTECLVPQPLKSFSWSTSCLTFLCLSFLICKAWCNDTLHFLSLWGGLTKFLF